MGRIKTCSNTYDFVADRNLGACGKRGPELEQRGARVAEASTDRAWQLDPGQQAGSGVSPALQLLFKRLGLRLAYDELDEPCRGRRCCQRLGYEPPLSLRSRPRSSRMALLTSRVAGPVGGRRSARNSARVTLAGRSRRSATRRATAGEVGRGRMAMCEHYRPCVHYYRRACDTATSRSNADQLWLGSWLVRRCWNLIARIRPGARA